MMTIGMLWFSNDPETTLEAKVARAVAHYKRKYNGAAPNVCYVNPAALPDGELLAAGVRVKPSRTVLPSHFWLGMES